MRKVLVIGFAAAAGFVQANSLTTIFTGGNRNTAGGGNYFQVTVGANPLEFTAFDINSITTVGTSFGFEVYTTPGTHAGNELNAGIWTLQATGTGTTMGLNIPSPVTLAAPFTLAPGSYGMAIFLRGGPGPAQLEYTNGNGSNQNFSNADLALALGTATNAFFGPSVFNPRVWNGTIYYNVVPEPATMAILGLGALALMRRRRR